MVSSVSFTIQGEPASKSNARRLILIGKRPRIIKSKKALDYVKSFKEQCPTLDELFSKSVSVTMIIYYASRRPDLDESLVLDAMQGHIYTNDRLVRHKNITGSIDPINPRCEITVEEYNYRT